MFEGEIEDAGGDDEIGPDDLLRNELLRNTELGDGAAGSAGVGALYRRGGVARQLVEPSAGTEAEMRALDPFAQCAARLSAAQEITQQTAELQINRAWRCGIVCLRSMRC